MNTPADSEASSIESEGEAANRNLRDEPREATRSSPHAVAAFALSLVSLWRVPVSLGPRLTESWAETVATIVGVVGLPIATAVVSFWLASRALSEIGSSNGRLGGVGYARAARAVAVISAGIAVVGTVFSLLAVPAIEKVNI
jgi:hypothetical protein